tara:strand:- start:314 stop:736 length:423 start_codon:yes stop_codon:yes gene_type:complete
MIQNLQVTVGTLMIIDDNSIDQMVYKRIVSRSEQPWSLVQFTDAETALEHLSDPSEPDPDLILLDINMPRMDGFEFLDAATTQLGAALCPIVVMLTTSLDRRDEQRARSFSVVRDFLNKPLTQDQLKRLASMVQHSKNAA